MSICNSWRCFNLITVVIFSWLLIPQISSASSAEACNDILKKNGAFNLIIRNSSKSAKENTFKWLRTATWKEFKKKQDAGLKIKLPIDDIPVELDGKYTEEEFNKFTELRSQGKLRNFTDEEFENTVSLTASPTIAANWLECMKINQDPKGLTCWAESDDHLENGIVVYKARYFPDSKLITKEPKVPKKGGLIVVGGTVVEPNPLSPKSAIPFGGVSVTIQRQNKKKITVALNSDTRGSCNTVTFPSISDIRRPFKIQVFSQTSNPPEAHPQVTVGLPSGYKLIGGGAQVNWRGNGNLLVASFPNGNTWSAKGKDHNVSDPSSITAWAIGLEDPSDQWDVKIVSNSVNYNGGAHGNVSVNLPLGYARTGGGAASEFGGEGRLLTGSYPNDSNGWIATDKDHENAQAGTLTAYVIGIKPRIGQTPELQIHTGTGAAAAHPVGSSSLDSEFILTGGGARASCSQGNLLTASFPVDSTTWRAEAKDHNISCGTTIDVWSIGIKPPPGSFNVEGGGPGLQIIRNFPGTNLLSIASIGALRPFPVTTTIPKSTYYISQQGDTYLALALKFYGNTDWSKILSANPKVSNGSVIPPGTKIFLPGL
jgi:phage tail protein X